MGTGGLELGRSPNSSDKKRSYRDLQPYLWPLRRVLSDFMVYSYIICIAYVSVRISGVVGKDFSCQKTVKQ